MQNLKIAAVCIGILFVISIYVMLQVDDLQVSHEDEATDNEGDKKKDS